VGQSILKLWRLRFFRSEDVPPEQFASLAVLHFSCFGFHSSPTSSPRQVGQVILERNIPEYFAHSRFAFSNAGYREVARFNHICARHSPSGRLGLCRTSCRGCTGLGISCSAACYTTSPLGVVLRDTLASIAHGTEVVLCLGESFSAALRYHVTASA